MKISAKLQLESPYECLQPGDDPSQQTVVPVAVVGGSPINGHIELTSHQAGTRFSRLSLKVCTYARRRAVDEWEETACKDPRPVLIQDDISADRLCSLEGCCRIPFQLSDAEIGTLSSVAGARLQVYQQLELEFRCHSTRHMLPSVQTQCAKLV